MTSRRTWLPPRIVRRLVLAPLMAVAAMALLVALPMWILATAFASRFVPGRWRALRVAWFLFVYLWWEVVVLVVLFAYWVASGFGRRIRTERWQARHFALAGWWLDRVIGSARRRFHVTITREGDAVDTSRPLLVFSRHAGPGDSFLLIDAVLNRAKMRPRIVFKDTLQLDPCVDVILNRIPSRFVPSSGRAGQLVIDAIAELARDMDRGDALILFPEGGNFTPRRRARAIEKLSEIGRDDLAARAESMQHVLPPKPIGALTAIDAAPGADVVFVGHVGLDDLTTVKDIWRGIPLDASVEVRLWNVDSADVPDTEARESWLYERWQEIDDWIDAKSREHELASVHARGSSA